VFAANIPGPKDHRRKPRRRELTFDVGVESSHGIGLPEERVRRLVRGGQKDHALDASREPRDDGRDRGRPGSPDKEHRLDAGERRHQRGGVREIADDDLDDGRERRGRGATHESADGAAESQELGDDGSADAAGCADDQEGGSIGLQ
jgi:hypothetical protein